MEHLLTILVFGGKVALLVVGVGILLILFFALLAKARQQKPNLSVEDLNEKFESMKSSLMDAVFDEKALKLERKELKKKRKAEASKDPDKKRVFVIDFHGDIRASHVDNLSEEISAILTVAKPSRDEVLLRLESPGGMVHTYGLAAAQLLRLRQAGVQLTVAVDKVAASGGYMMACTADRILAAPFAIIGSIGVIAQVPNFHRLLKKNSVDYEEVTAGEFKRTVSLFGEITDKGRQKFSEQLESTHVIFKDFVQTYRPKLNIAEVATGEYWYGEKSLKLGLVDQIISSDGYLFSQRYEARLFKIEIQARKKWSEKLVENLAESIDAGLLRWWSRSNEPRISASGL